MSAEKKVRTGGDQLARDICAAIGAPQHTSRIELTIDAGEIITARVTYYQELSQVAAKLVKDFVLIDRVVAAEKGLI